MGWKWIVENPPQWDGPKRQIVAGVPEGIFRLPEWAEGDLLPGEWWRVESDHGDVVGYGWMDCTWGDAEVLLAVDSAHQGGGVGGYILDQLEREAASRGLHYLHNVVQPTHPDRDKVAAWLGRNGFARDHDDDLLKRPVRHGEPQ